VGTRHGLLAAAANKADFAAMIELIEAGQVRVHIDKRFPLSSVPQALRYLGEGKALGKVVITL
jgi:NADPH:quinone reductase-like Zn-dependent oxidoreductase